jgi:glutaredoxin-like YruB-family protein
MAAPRITLYSARNCPNCRQAKQYLQQHGLRFQEFDVNHSARAQKALAQMGARGVPVILIGEERIDGFDRKRLDAVLQRLADS